MIKKPKRSVPLNSKIGKSVKPIAPVQLDPLSEQLVVNKMIRTLKHINKTGQAVRNDNTKIKTKPVIYKQLKVLIISTLSEENDWQTDLVITDHFRYLVKEVQSVKANCSLSDMLRQMKPDLLLVLGNPGLLSYENIMTVLTASVTKAAWLSDITAMMEPIRYAASVLDCVFSQSVTNIPMYQYVGCRQVVYLPFAAERSVYYPQLVEERYRSDILFIGDAHLSRNKHIQGVLALMEGRKVVALGEGWEKYDRIMPIRREGNLQEYYNGADIIINWQPSQRQVLEMCACGKFLLAEDHPNLYGFTNPGEDLIVFRHAEDLCEKLQYYLEQPDQRRMIATRALWRSKYDYSCLQMVMKLLEAAFNS